MGPISNENFINIMQSLNNWNPDLQTFRLKKVDGKLEVNCEDLSVGYLSILKNKLRKIVYVLGGKYLGYEINPQLNKNARKIEELFNQAMLSEEWMSMSVDNLILCNRALHKIVCVQNPYDKQLASKINAIRYWIYDVNNFAISKNFVGFLGQCKNDHLFRQELQQIFPFFIEDYMTSGLEFSSEELQQIVEACFDEDLSLFRLIDDKSIKHKYSPSTSCKEESAMAQEERARSSGAVVSNLLILKGTKEAYTQFTSAQPSTPSKLSYEDFIKLHRDYRNNLTDTTKLHQSIALKLIHDLSKSPRVIEIVKNDLVVKGMSEQEALTLVTRLDHDDIMHRFLSNPENVKRLKVLQGLSEHHVKQIIEAKEYPNLAQLNQGELPLSAIANFRSSDPFVHFLGKSLFIDDLAGNAQNQVYSPAAIGFSINKFMRIIAQSLSNVFKAEKNPIAAMKAYYEGSTFDSIIKDREYYKSLSKNEQVAFGRVHLMLRKPNGEELTALENAWKASKTLDWYPLLVEELNKEGTKDDKAIMLYYSPNFAQFSSDQLVHVTKNSELMTRQERYELTLYALHKIYAFCRTQLQGNSPNLNYLAEEQIVQFNVGTLADKFKRKPNTNEAEIKTYEEAMQQLNSLKIEESTQKIV